MWDYDSENKIMINTDKWRSLVVNSEQNVTQTILTDNKLGMSNVM